MKNEYGIVGVAHIGLPTNDLKKTIEFYKSLGFEVILETYNEKAKEKVAFLQIQVSITKSHLTIFSPRLQAWERIL